MKRPLPSETLVAGTRPIESLYNHQKSRLKELWFAGELTGLRGERVARACIPVHETTMRKLSERAPI